MLREAIASCLGNRYRPLEILVGDDSERDDCRSVVAALDVPDGVTIDYRHNRPRLGQPRNLNALMARAQGDRLIVLHDDDRLIAGTIDLFDRAWRQHDGLVAVYGKRRVIDLRGRPADRETRALERSVFGADPHAGVQASAVAAAIAAHLPPDGFMVDAALARSVGYGCRTFRGDVCDYDFGVRLAAASGDGRFCMIDRFTADYRMSVPAISLVSYAHSGRFEALSRLRVDGGDAAARAAAMRVAAPGAIGEYARQGRRREALAVFLSRHYGRWLSVKAPYHLAAIAWPGLAEWRSGVMTRRQARYRARLTADGDLTAVMDGLSSRDGQPVDGTSQRDAGVQLHLRRRVEQSPADGVGGVGPVGGAG